MSTQNKNFVKAMAVLGMLLTTLIWGSSFVVMKNSMDSITPTYLLAYRFSVATIAMLIVFFPKVKTMSKADLKYGMLIGTFLFISYIFQTYGLKYTTASKNAFITTLYVVVVPFLHWFFNKKKPGKSNIAAAGIAVVGLAFISLEGDLSINLGDFLTLICGLGFAFQMIFIDKYTESHDPIRLTIIQVGTCAVFSWILAPVLDGIKAFDLTVFQDSNIVFSILYLGLISSMVCFSLQTVSQKYLSANTASILLSFESVFGLLFAVLLLGEPITIKLLLGCGLMFCAILISEYRPRERIKN